jgi:hypothetical protein
MTLSPLSYVGVATTQVLLMRQLFLSLVPSMLDEEGSNSNDKESFVQLAVRVNLKVFEKSRERSVSIMGLSAGGTLMVRELNAISATLYCK